MGGGLREETSSQDESRPSPPRIVRCTVSEAGGGGRAGEMGVSPSILHGLGQM